MALTLNGSTGIAGIAGSAGTPALQGNNDANTGYFFATDTLGLSTAGSERLRIDSSGNLIVNKDNARTHAVIILSKADAGYAKLEFDVGTSQKAYIELDASEDLVHYGAAGVAQVFYAGGSERFKIQSDGLKEIKNGRLRITSTFIDFSGNVSTPSTGAAIFRPAGDTLAVSTNNEERVRITSGGLVLIGTTTEGNASADDLTVATSGTTGITIRSGDTSTGNIYFSDATSGTGEFAGAIEYAHNGNSLRLHSNSAERLRIDSSGYVGINETSPSSYYSKDLVLKCAAAEGGLTIRSNATTDTNYVMFADGTSGNEQYRGYISYHHNSGTSGGEHIQLGVAGNSRVYRFYSDGVALGGETAAANRLDDYEEGTWTPLIASTGTAFNSVTNWSSDSRYTKIGRIVTIQCYHRTGGIDKGSASASDGVVIGGLPFTPTNSTQRSTVVIGQNVNWAQDPNTATVQENTTSIYLYKYASSGGNNSGTPLTVADVGTAANNNYAIFTLVYESD